MINPPLTEGEPMTVIPPEENDPQIAELKRRFGGEGWVFDKVWITAASGPDHRNLTAMRGVVILVAPDVASLAEQIRHEEDAAHG